MLDIQVKSALNRSAYLKERSLPPIIESADVQDEFQQWQKMIPQQVMEKRFAQDNLTLEQFKQYLGEKDVPALKQQLTWQDTLEEIIHSYEKEPLEYVSFQALIHPFFQYAGKRIKAECRRMPEGMMEVEQISESIAVALSERLNSMVLKSAILEITIAGNLGLLEGETSEERFQRFVRRYDEQGSARMEFFTYYPVLTRLLVENTLSCIQFAAELLQRYVQDWALLQQTIGDCSRLHRLKLGLGDTHQNGRAVALLEFASGTILVYKPRSLSVDKCYESIISWTNSKGLQHALMSATCVDQGSYGWQAFVPFKPCDTEEEVRRFYYRQGAHTALFYALNSSDFHAENIIAHGEYPIPIDLETLFSKNSELVLSQNIKSQLTVELSDSVYSSLMLPIPRFDSELFDYDLSSFGAKDHQQSEKMMANFVENMGRDDIRIVRRVTTSGTYQNRPVLRGEEVSPTDYFISAEAGFREMYLLLLKHRDEFCSPQGPLHVHGEAKVRQVFRPTHVYSEFLVNSLHPDYLQNGLDRVRLFDLMWQISNQSKKFEEVVSMETKDLLRHDIPYFYFQLNRTDLFDSDGSTMTGFFEQTGLEAVKAKLYSLSIENYEKQAQYFRWAIISLLGDVWGNRKITNEQLATVAEAPLSFVQEAKQLAKNLANRAIIEEDRETNWLGLNLTSQQGVQVSVKGIDLYDGLTGFVLFFAYLAEETGDDTYKDLALGALKTIEKKTSVMSEHGSTSAFSGEGAVQYALVHLGLLWKDESLIERAASRLPNVYAMVDNEQVFDFVGGLAGFVVVCLHIYHELQAEAYLDLAKHAGMKLSKYVSNLNQQELIPGLAHGAAGLAWPLHDLWNCTGEQHYRQQAEMLVSYENSLYDSENAKWNKHPHRSGEKHEDIYWCHGSPGIGLARLMMAASASQPLQKQISKDVEVALSQIASNGVLNNDSLCHGTLGNVDILLVAAQHLQQERYIELGRDIGRRAVLRAHHNGWQCGLDPRVEMDGFMLGRTGIGYALMRLERPDMPSVLALELPKRNRR